MEKNRKSEREVVRHREKDRAYESVEKYKERKSERE